MEEIAIIKITDGNCHLEYSFNEWASDPIQIEEYASYGWNEPVYKFKGITDRQFWNIWCDWNENVTGGITLHDGNTEEEIEKFINSFGNENHAVGDIPTLPNGTYRIYADPA